MKILGFIIPHIVRQRIYLNRDLTMVDTGKEYLEDEVGPYYVEPLAIEWLGWGFAIPGRQVLYDTNTNEPTRR